MIVIFAGPTIAHEEVAALIECECLPPVSHGSILKLDLTKVSAIGIIDGYFEGAPSVWHKEILYAMDQGVHVYGASSMGALRAAELHAFGMRGIGQIFEWYRDLVIEDDDEVAVLHGPAEAGYAVASEPMVSVRRTLQLAVDGKVIGPKEYDELISLAKSTFYKERNWNSLLAGDQWCSLLAWVKEHRVDLKKNDAVEMLRRMDADQSEFDARFETDYPFEWTNVWDSAFRSIRGGGEVSSLSQDENGVLDELKLKPDQYRVYADRALTSWMERNPLGDKVTGNVREALKRFRVRHGLGTRMALMAYMERVGLDEAGLESLMEQDARLIVAEEAAGDLSLEILEQLRLGEVYSALLGDARKKIETMELAGVSVEGAGVKRGSYLVWYFERVLGVEVPHDLERYVLENGFRSGEEFDRVVIGEYLYRRCLVEE